jgi:hypothetical protein
MVALPDHKPAAYHNRLHGDRQACGPPAIRRGGSGNGTSSGTILIMGIGRGFGCGAGRRFTRARTRTGFGCGGSPRRISASAFKCHR